MASRQKTTQASGRRRRPIDVILGFVGELLITVGIVVGLFLVWQLWWTNIDANASANQHRETFQSTQVESPRSEGTKHYDDPPALSPVGYGETIGMLIVPKWYGVTNNNMPILEGTGADVLDQAAAGHYSDTQRIGEIGNAALAGHRRSMGNSFLRIDTLEEGDEIIVSTADTWYVYKVTSHEIVQPEAVEVIAPVPGDFSAEPTERMLTLTTCHSATLGEWGNDQRWIVHAKLDYWMPRSEGRPASVIEDEGVN